MIFDPIYTCISMGLFSSTWFHTNYGQYKLTSLCHLFINWSNETGPTYMLYSGKLSREKTFMNLTVWEPPVNSKFSL